MKRLKRIIINVFIFIIMFIIASLNLWWAFFLFCLFCYIDIYIHELGHASAGLAVKFSIKRISIGTGRDLVRKKIAGTLFIVTSGLTGGFTAMGDVSGKFLKVRYALFVLGGVGAQAFAIVIIMVLYSVNLFELPGIKTLSVAHVFIYSNLYLMILSLIAHKTKISGFPIYNDGLILIKLPFNKEIDLQLIKAAGEIIEALELSEDKRFNEAEIVLKNSIVKYPELPILKINLSAVFVKQLRIKEMIMNLECLIEDYTEDEYSFLLYNNLAYAYLLRNDQNDLQKADEYSEKAFTENNEVKAIIGTRASVLIEKGAVDEGIALLEKIVNIGKKVDEKTNNPQNIIALAYAYYLKNEIEKAIKYIDKFETYSKPLDADDQMYLNYVKSKTNNFGRELVKDLK